MSAREELRAVQYLLARPAFAAPLGTFGHACPLASCAGRPGALTLFFRTRPQLFALDQETTTTTTVQLVLHSEPVLLIRFLTACPGSRSTLAAVGAQCPLASCAGRPGAYARFVRSRPHYFELLEGGSVRLVAYGEAPAPAPSADEDARAQRGLGGVAGCALCAIPYFSSAQQRREHEGGAPHRRLRDAAAAAAAQLGVQRGGGGPAAPPQARPEHGLQLCLAPAPGAPAAAAPAVTEAALEAAPRSQATLQLLLRNCGSGAWVLDEALAHPASPELGIVAPKGGLGVLVPGTTISVQLHFSPEQAGSSRAHLSLHLLPLLKADGTEGHRSPVLLGCALALHCLDPAEAAALAALAPTAPYRRPQRRRRFAGGEAAEPPPRERSRPGEEAFYQPPRVSLAPAAGSTDPGSPGYARLEAALSGECVGAAARAKRLGLLLLCEEDAARKDMAAFDMEGVRLRVSGGATASLEVPGLAEARPSVKRDDSVLLSPTGSGGGGGGGGGRGGGRGGGDGTHRGSVAEVARTTLALRLGPHALARAAAGCAFDVQFELRRGSYLLQHAALALESRGVVDEGVAALLEAPRGALGGAVGESAAADAVLRAAARLPAPLHIHPPLNAPQRVAVAGALHRFPGERAQPPYVVFGPPGTGKTTTLAEYVLQALAGAGGGGGAGAAGGAEEAAGGEVSGLSAAMAQLVLGASRLSARSDALEALLAPQQRQPPALVLVTAPSNSAVDGLAVKLLRAGLPAAHLLRVNAFTRAEKDMPAEVRPSAAALWSEEGGGGYRLPDADAISRARVVAATCSTAQRLIRTLLLKGAGASSAGGGGLFSHIIVDEAGQCTDPETLCAVAGGLRRGGRVVLAGDPRQLGPVLRSDLAREHGLGVSTLERLMRSGPHAAAEGGGGGGGGGGDPRRPLGYHPAYCTMLNVNYRSHPALVAVPNALFYGGALQAAGEGGGGGGGGGGVLSLCDWPGLTAAARSAQGGFPLLVHGVRGRDLQEGSSPSYFNPEEAVAAVAHIASVLAYARTSGLKPSDCGIVTPYHKQAVKIKQLLAKSPALEGVAVGSVELFQGAERSVIVVSTVRASSALLGFDAKHALGFLDNPRRFNVAVTRARALLVVVGDPAILAQDDSWSALLRYAAAHGAYRGCALPEGLGGAAGAGGGGGGGEGLLQRLRAQAAAAEEAEAAEGATSYDY